MTEIVRLTGVSTSWYRRLFGRGGGEIKRKKKNISGCFSCRMGQKDGDDKDSIEQSSYLKNVNVSVACCSTTYTRSIDNLNVNENKSYVTV